MPTALLVADATWVVNDVRAALAVGDWQIVETSDPETVVDRIQESPVDAVIIDMQVGSMGGMAIVRAIRQAIDGRQRPRTVILLDRSADMFLARRAGASAAVLKPINDADLRMALGMIPVRVRADEEE